MSIDIKLFKNDLPEDLKLGNTIAVDCEFMGLRLRRDPLCLIQISTGKKDAYIVQFDRKNIMRQMYVKFYPIVKLKKFFIMLDLTYLF